MLVDTGDYHGLIFNRLREEHREIRAMLDALLRLADHDAAGRRATFARFAEAVRIHARAEEEIVFPVLDGTYELGHHVREDAKDHRAIEALIRAVELSPAEGPGWRTQVYALKSTLDHHFADEENVVFPLAEEVVSSPHARDILFAYEQEREFLTRTR
jgi:hemerythrin-like domain-containing protein